MATPQDPRTEAIDRVREYIRHAMRPHSIAQAVSEGPWDRGRRSGLQEALNAIDHEFKGQAEGEP